MYVHTGTYVHAHALAAAERSVHGVAVGLVTELDT